MRTNRETLLQSLTTIEGFNARGNIRIDDNLLNYDAKNGILSFRFVERKDINKRVIEKLNNTWTSFEEFRDTEHGPIQDGGLSRRFTALLSYGYRDEYSLCFYIKALVLNSVKNSSITGIEVYSPCLIDHFYNVWDFDFSTNGFIEDVPCAEIDIEGIHFRIHKTVAVSYRRDFDSSKCKFPKQYVGGFVFYADKDIDCDIIYKIVSSIISYCNFLLCDSGNYICNVALLNETKYFRDNIFCTKKVKELVTEVRFKYDDIVHIFKNLIKLYLIDKYDFKNLYLLESNVYNILDILRVTSMFENIYRKSCQLGIKDYVEKENEYKIAYCHVIRIGNPQTDQEKEIAKKEKDRMDNFLLTSLRSRLKFVFKKLLQCLDVTKGKVANSFNTCLTGYDMSNLPNRIADARNDIAHYLEKNKDYNTALIDIVVLQVMIYYMVFEQLGLSAHEIKKLILGDSRQMRQLFSID